MTDQLQQTKPDEHKYYPEVATFHHRSGNPIPKLTGTLPAAKH